MTPRVRVLGIRHHGPGSARAVGTALAEYQPELLLVEGPADADAMIPWAAAGDMVPPVALLAYAAKEPSRASYFPMAEFSPEWVALRWAAAHEVNAQFMDLPAANQLALRHEPEEEDDGEEVQPRPADPIALLADAAGYTDPEAWWEDLVENSGSESDVFDVIAEAMAGIRDRDVSDDVGDGELFNARREAHMRKVLRKALKSDAERIAVVCGAWHAPALSSIAGADKPFKLPPATADSALLKQLPKVPTTVTWVPWTHSRLSFASGYGAGVTSPGWYAHLFSAPDRPVARWMTIVAHLLRGRDLPVSSAHIIEAVRLADTLAALRARPQVGLPEVTDAVRSVMLDGSVALAQLVEREVIVGESLGSVADGVPMVPLEADLRAEAKRLRLTMSATPKEITFDLRKDNDRAKSQLLHRLRILGIGWGERRVESGTGTFKEGWTLAWEPEFAVRIVEASVWGTTVPAAAAAHLTEEATSLETVAQAVNSALTADLASAMPDLLRLLDRHAAKDSDISHLMAAVPPLVRAGRYGDVRDTDASELGRVSRALLARIRAGLPGALGGLGEEPSAELTVRIDDVTSVIGLLDGERDPWLATLAGVAERHDVDTRTVGRLTRILVDNGILISDDAAVRLSRAMTGGHTVGEKAAWIDGFCSGGALLLIHDPALLPVLDTWVCGLSDDDFDAVVPVLRRTFGAFAPAERRTIGRKIAGATAAASSRGSMYRGTGVGDGDRGLDPVAAAPALATIRMITDLEGDDEQH